MNWNPLYLRAADEAEMMAALDAAGLVSIDEEDQHIGGDPFCIRVKLLGTLFEETGETLPDAEGVEYPEMAPIPGYHANIIVRPDCLEQYTAALATVIIDPPPNTPEVKYAGCA